MKVKGTESSQRGSAMVEAAATLLTLLVLLFGIFEAGRMLNIQQTLTNAAREGARLSVLPAAATGSPPAPSDTLAPTDKVRSRVRTFLDAAGLNGAVVLDSDILVDQAYEPVAGTKYSRVTVTVPYTVLTISMFNVLPQLKLQGRAMMRNETNLQ